MYAINFGRRLCETTLPLLPGQCSAEQPSCATVSLTEILTLKHNLNRGKFFLFRHICLSELVPLEEEATISLIKISLHRKT